MAIHSRFRAPFSRPTGPVAVLGLLACAPPGWAQFALSHISCLVAYPVAGQQGAKTGWA